MLTFISPALQAQVSISGRVVDKNGKAIAYAHIFIPATTCGALSGDDGTFTLNCEHTPSAKDSVKVSYLGYRIKAMSLGGMKRGNNEIVLTEESQQLTLVDVLESRKTKSGEYRFDPPSKKARGWYQKNVATTYQLASRVANEENIEGYLKEIKFHIGKASSDQSTIRLFFYALDDSCNCPGKPLNGKDIILEKLRKGWNTVDLLPFIVDLPPTDFFVGFEWLGIQNKDRKELDFSIGLVPHKGSGDLFEKEGGKDWSVKNGLGSGRPLVKIEAIY